MKLEDSGVIPTEITEADMRDITSLVLTSIDKLEFTPCEEA